MNEEVRKAIELLEKYVESQKDELKKLSNLIDEAKGNNPIIENGYFRITDYWGYSKYIEIGKVYKGRTFVSVDGQRRNGYIPKTHTCFNESNASWIIASKEEYINQRKSNKG